MISVVDHKTSTPKDVEELDIRFAVVKARIRSFTEMLANNASVLNKACYGHCFSPEIERKVCEVKHRSGYFYQSSISSLY